MDNHIEERIQTLIALTLTHLTTIAVAPYLPRYTRTESVSNDRSLFTSVLFHVALIATRQHAKLEPSPLRTFMTLLHNFPYLCMGLFDTNLGSGILDAVVP
jgi:hypothetical protein